MTATITAPRAVAAPPSGRSRAALARLERPLLLGGLALVTLHLLDLTFSGPETGHTAGLRTHPSEYERRTTTFLDRALGLTETP